MQGKAKMVIVIGVIAVICVAVGFGVFFYRDHQRLKTSTKVYCKALKAERTPSGGYATITRCHRTVKRPIIKSKKKRIVVTNNSNIYNKRPTHYSQHDHPNIRHTTPIVTRLNVDSRPYRQPHPRSHHRPHHSHRRHHHNHHRHHKHQQKHYNPKPQVHKTVVAYHEKDQNCGNFYIHYRPDIDNIQGSTF